MRLILVHNPASGQNRRRRLDLRSLREVPQLTVLLTGEGHDPAAIAGRILERAPDLLLVSGGDGTLHRLLSGLLAISDPKTDWPPFAILPHGTANMAAADLGLLSRAPDAATLRRLLAQLAADELRPQLVERPIVEVQLGQNQALAGLFFGTGAVCDAIEYWTRRFRRRGMGGKVSQAMTFLLLLLRLILRGPEGAGLRGHRGWLKVAGGEPVRGHFLLTIATTLERLLLGARPFWQFEGASLRVTAIEQPVPKVARHVLAVLRGRPGPRLPPEYRSFAANELLLSGPDRFVVDGEVHCVPAGRTLVVRAGRRVHFARLVR